LRSFWMLLMLAGVLSADAWALTLDEIDIGEQIRGPYPTLTVNDFTGKVVLVDLWGIQCVPCIQQMPALQDLYAKYRFNGFHIVALEKQGKTNGEAFEFFSNATLFKGSTLQFQFTYAGRSSIPGRYVPFLPANFLFNPDGYLIGTNLHGAELENKIKEVLPETLETITRPGEVGRLAEYETRLKSGINMLATLSALVVKKKEAIEKNDKKVIDEATLLFTGVFDWANKKFDRAIAEKERLPMASLLRLKTLVRSLPGTTIGTKAAKALADLENDPRVIKEIRANKELRDIVTQITDMKQTAAGSRDPNDPEFRKINIPAMQVLKENCIRLLNVCPETEAAPPTQAIFDDFRLKDVN